MTSSAKALAGTAVVSLAVNLPGPLAVARLASFGASVTKVEPPAGDPLQSIAPDWYDELIADQEVIALDLKDPDARADLEERLATADVLITAMRPSALERLGIGDSAQRHGLVLVEIVGYDADKSEEPGHDLTYQAAHGTLTPPAVPSVPIVDLLGAERAVSAVLTGLQVRAASGGMGVRERVVLDDVAFDISAPIRHRITGPGDPLGGGMAAYGVYRTSDGHVAVGAVEPHFADRLATAIGRSAGDLARRFVTQPSQYWESLGRTLDIPIVAVRDARTVSRSHRPPAVAPR